MHFIPSGDHYDKPHNFQKVEISTNFILFLATLKEKFSLAIKFLLRQSSVYPSRAHNLTQQSRFYLDF